MLRFRLYDTSTAQSGAACTALSASDWASLELALFSSIQSFKSGNAQRRDKACLASLIAGDAAGAVAWCQPEAAPQPLPQNRVSRPSPRGSRNGEMRTFRSFTFRASLTQHSFARAARSSLCRSGCRQTGRSGAPIVPEPRPNFRRTLRQYGRCGTKREFAAFA